MKTLVAFFEIPAVDFNRAIQFYETILNAKLTAMDYGHEKMAFFPKEYGLCIGAISWAADNSFLPSENGVLVSLNVESIEKATQSISTLGGKILIPKTKIEAEGRGYFSVFIDCEGNRVGLYSDK
jgi:Predicted enzyme related to lactoylglutathione lyase